MSSFVICATCGVERSAPTEVCPICADERQYVRPDGQRWTALDALAAERHITRTAELEPDLLSLTSEPEVGIGQHAHLVTTPAGSVLWDPIGFLDDDGVAAIRARGPVLAIAASHPHMFGVQVQWSHALGEVPVLVAEPDLAWVGRPDPVIESWRGRRELSPGLALVQTGGHFPGSAVLHWSAGAGGRGVVFSSDTFQVNADRATVTFLRSYPNRIPLSSAVALRVAATVGELAFDRVYDNFGRSIAAGGADAVRRSAERHAAWARGDFDDLT